MFATVIAVRGLVHGERCVTTYPEWTDSFQGSRRSGVIHVRRDWSFTEQVVFRRSWRRPAELAAAPRPLTDS